MLDYRPFPHEIYKPMVSGQFIEGGQAYKPVFGSIGTLPVRFYMGSSYNEAKSAELGVETYDKEEMCEITVDKFTKHTPRVKDLDRKQMLELSPLLHAFREQKDSTDTQIISWMIITEMDRAHLVSQGVYTVEQLAAFDPDQEAYRFGRGGRDLIMKARQHLAGKGQDKVKEREKEYQMLLDEVAKLRAKDKEREELYLQGQMQRADAEKKGRTPKPEQVTA